MVVLGVCAVALPPLLFRMWVRGRYRIRHCAVDVGIVLARVVTVVAFALGGRRCSLVLALRFGRSHGDIRRRAAGRCLGHGIVARIATEGERSALLDKSAIECDKGDAIWARARVQTKDWGGIRGCSGSWEWRLKGEKPTFE